MVEWLREVGMPADFINKLSRMFQDIKVNFTPQPLYICVFQVSEDLNNQFKEQHKDRDTKYVWSTSIITNQTQTVN